MSWQENVPRQGSKPEEQARAILSEMGLSYDMNLPLEDGFTIYPREADLLVEGVLVIEVQGSGKWLHDNPRRKRKDLAKRRSVEASGYGYLELWDDELEKACQVKAGVEWRPKVKELITKSLADAKLRHRIYAAYRNQLGLLKTPMVEWPGVGLVAIDRRRE